MCEKHVFPAAVEQNGRRQSLVWVSTPARDNLFCFRFSGTIRFGLKIKAERFYYANTRRCVSCDGMYPYGWSWSFWPCTLQANFCCPIPLRLSSLPTQQHDDVSSTSGHSTSRTLPVLRSAAIGYYNYLPCSCLSPHISRGRLSQISRVHSLLTRLPCCWYPAIAGNFSRRKYRTYSARPFPADNRRSMWCFSVRLWVRQALPVSRHARAHCRMYFSVSRKRPLLDDERTPVVKKNIRTRSKQIYEEVVYSTPKCCTWTDFFNKNFLRKI